MKNSKNKAKAKAKATEAKANKTNNGKTSKKKRIGLAALAVAAAYLAFSYFGNNTIKPKSAEEASRTTVMIVRMDHKSGGTGVILQSGPRNSYILTNGHVCHVVENGGIVSREGQEYLVSNYRKSLSHDLCLITVNGNLGVSTELAPEPPTAYSDAMVSGHPRLLPTVITRGHFSGKQTVEVLTGFRKCTNEDMKGDSAVLCMFFGGIPQITRYETQLVTATIQPGSSGSAVFNDKGQLSNLVFACGGDIGYAHTVPYEAVYNFVTSEVYQMEIKYPLNTWELGLSAQPARSSSELGTPEIDPESNCKSSPQLVTVNESIKRICKIIEKGTVWAITRTI